VDTAVPTIAPISELKANSNSTFWLDTFQANFILEPNGDGKTA